ncbi:MAG: hypothetical protein AOA66_0255 [Candidatus Bathyarchaeota archaeon BA2]|nr:MAG: hypothetical protein AOA66_0255 [Candidatus Bathyarchaeota archaeon BA2]
MSYNERWKVLADLLTELRKRGEKIPPDVMNDLRSAKTMIEILKADPTHIENIPKLEAYMGNVESYLIFAAQKKFGLEFVEQWMKKLEEARRAVKVEGKAEAPPRFVPGLPKGKRWVRVQISEDTSQEDIERIARENKLLCKMQKNGYMLVYGSSESIKTFVKKMAEKFRGARKR